MEIFATIFKLSAGNLTKFSKPSFFSSLNDVVLCYFTMLLAQQNTHNQVIYKKMVEGKSLLQTICRNYSGEKREGHEEPVLI
jgi:hypothetical protein